MRSETPAADLEDEELELVVQVIRRGLQKGNQIEVLSPKLTVAIGALSECRTKLKEQQRLGLEIANSYRRSIDPTRKHPLTGPEAMERTKWIFAKMEELKNVLGVVGAPTLEN